MHVYHYHRYYYLLLVSNNVSISSVVHTVSISPGPVHLPRRQRPGRGAKQVCLQYPPFIIIHLFKKN